jgi:hypothetical protein
MFLDHYHLRPEIVNGMNLYPKNMKHIGKCPGIVKYVICTFILIQRTLKNVME